MKLICFFVQFAASLSTVELMVKVAVSLVASQVTLESGPAERLLGEKAAERREPHQSRSVQSESSVLSVKGNEE